MEKILIVEDAQDFQIIISRTLSKFQLTIVSSSEEASQAVYREQFDLIILDLGLPGKSGYEFLTDLQDDEKTKDIPVICVTGKAEITDKTTAFSLGADDYIVKPFNPIELKARVEGRLSKLRRRKKDEHLFFIGKIKIDKSLHQVYLIDENGAENEIDVTQTEFKILCYLAKRVGQVYSRDQLLVGVWGENANVLERVVDVHVCSLRKKLKRYSHYIRAVPGYGYSISLPVASRSEAPKLQTVREI